jgi:hypothetical protein
MKILKLKLPVSILKEVGLSTYLKNFYSSEILIRIFISGLDKNTFCLEILALR